MRLPGPSLRSDIAACAGAMTLALLLAALALHLWNADLQLPFDYGGDANLTQIVIKGTLDHGWFQHNPDLAAPFGQNLLDFPVYSGETLQFLIMKVIGLFTGNAALVMNLFFLLGFPLATLTAFIVLRLLGIGRLAAATVAVLYAIAPFHFLRGEYHLFIGAYYAVPLGILLALLLTLGRPLPRARWLIPLCIVIGSAHVYYAVFTLALLSAAIVLRLIAEDGWRALVPGIATVGLIVAVVVANHLPNIIYAHEHGPNPAVSRLPSESERFGLKLVEMVLPVPDHRIGALAHLRAKYHPAVDSVNEGDPQALGTLATLGLAWLFIVLLLARTRRVRPLTDELQIAAARLAAVAFVAGTVGGISALVTYFLTDQVRAWGRISIVLAFLSLIPLALLIDHATRTRGLRLAAALAAVLLALGFLDQTNAGTPFGYAATAHDYRADGALIDAMEANLPHAARVFELPFEEFPEPQPAFLLESLSSYALGRPYLHSHDLRWSYGAMKGRADGWQRAAGALPPALLARGVAAVGFAAILLDRSSYSDEGDRVIAAIQQETGAEPEYAPNKRLVYFDLRAYAKRVLAGQNQAALRHDFLDPVRLTFNGAFSAPRQSDEHVWRYVGTGPAVLQLENPDTAARRVRVAMTLAAPADRTVRVRISAPGQAAQTVAIGRGDKRVELNMTAPPGVTPVRLDVAGVAQHLLPDVGLPYDLLVQDPVVADDALVRLGPAPASPLSSNAGSPFID